MNNHQISWASPFLFGNEKKLLLKALNSTWISGGKYIDQFENFIKKKFKINNAFLVSNGTTALHLAFLSVGLKKGDEIIVPGYGYMAAANIGNLMNLNVKFADVNKETYCINLQSLKKVITNKTKAVVTIHTYGNMYDIFQLKKFLKKKKIILIEDAAEAFSCQDQGKYSGTIGDIGTYSFHATKNIVTGEGGMVVTNNKIFAKKIVLYRSHGVGYERYKHLLFGHNFRITNIQAALGFGQIKNLVKIQNKRILIYKWYINFLDHNKIKLQKINNSFFVPWTLALTLNSKKKTTQYILDKLSKKNIEIRKGFYSANRLKIYKNNNYKILKNSNYLSKNIICLPIHVGLKKKDIKYICKIFNKII
jgi:perosamine synthetase